MIALCTQSADLRLPRFAAPSAGASAPPSLPSSNIHGVTFISTVKTAARGQRGDLIQPYRELSYESLRADSTGGLLRAFIKLVGR